MHVDYIISGNYEVKIGNVGCRENLVSNRIVKEMKNYKDIHFSCNTQDERFGLVENVNSKEREEFQSMFGGEMNIEHL